MKVLICGDRNWNDYGSIAHRISKLPLGTIVVHGAARGADRSAGIAAAACGLEVQEFPADWTTYGKAAGPIRNIQMLDQKPDLVIAFHEDLASSKGTAHTVREAQKRSIPVEVITGKLIEVDCPVCGSTLEGDSCPAGCDSEVMCPWQDW